MGRCAGRDEAWDVVGADGALSHRLALLLSESSGRRPARPEVRSGGIVTGYEIGDFGGFDSGLE